MSNLPGSLSTQLSYLKQQAAWRAVDLVESGMVLGLGTGSTAIFAGVDTALEMKKRDTSRTIESHQRYGEDIPKIVLSFDCETGLTAEAGTVEEMVRELAERRGGGGP